MKKVKIISVFLIVMLMQFGLVYAKYEEKPIEKVTISGIDYPYSTGSVLDTTANLTKNSESLISKIYWTKISQNKNMVTIVVRPNIYFYYDENTTATVNGKPANSIIINDDEYLEVSYIFETDNTISLPNSSNSLKHDIHILYMKNGTISPNPIKAPHNKNFTVQIIPDEGYEVEDVLIDGESVGAVTKYTFKKVSTTHKIKAYFKEIEGYEPSTDVPEKEFPFTDVSENDWYYESVKYVFDKEIFSGTSATKFSPKNNMTRAMLVKALYNMEIKREEPSNEVNQNIFDDVSEDAWYKDAVAWAASNDIVNGIGNNLFAPDKEVTREQVASILYRYAKYIGKDVSVGENTNILSYDDFNEISEYAIPGIQWACGSGVINGKTASMVAPKETATRAEVAKMLTSFLENV